MVRWLSFLTEPYPSPPAHRSTRWVLRATLAALGRFVKGVEGAARLRAMDGPFVAALNHSQRLEAFLVPALLAWLRGGRILRFLADWNFMLLPPVYVLYKSARIIPVTRKPARPRVLTPLRNVLTTAPRGFEGARQCLERGQPVGLFVEGTTNRHPTRLLRGQQGAARLSLDTGVPVLPIGIRFPEHAGPEQPIADGEMLSVHVGHALTPPAPGTMQAPASDLVADWHATIMRAVANCSGTTWHPHHTPSALRLAPT